MWSVRPYSHCIPSNVGSVTHKVTECLSGDYEGGLETSVCGACVIFLSPAINSIANSSSTMILTSACQQSIGLSMPVSSGYVEDKPLGKVRQNAKE